MPERSRRAKREGNHNKGLHKSSRRKLLQLRRTPSLTILPFASNGSFSLIGNIKEEPNTLLKYPRWKNDLCLTMLKVESKILDFLGSHQRIVRYFGDSERPKGIKLGREVNGDLQCWIDEHPTIDHPQRLEWCRQAAEAVAYIHTKDVLHCDLRPANFLVTENNDLRLCDFGGSKLHELYGRGLPNAGFYDPNDKNPVSRSTDMFALGSCMYTIMTGHFPCGTRGKKTHEEEEAYNIEVTRLLVQRQFPDVRNNTIGNVILGCWKSDIRAEEVVRELRDIQNIQTMIYVESPSAAFLFSDLGSAVCPSPPSLFS